MAKNHLAVFILVARPSTLPCRANVCNTSIFSVYNKKVNLGYVSCQEIWNELPVVQKEICRIFFLFYPATFRRSAPAKCFSLLLFFVTLFCATFRGSEGKKSPCFIPLICAVQMFFFFFFFLSFLLNLSSGFEEAIQTKEYSRPVPKGYCNS